MNYLENEDFIPLSDFIDEMGSIDYFIDEQFAGTNVSMSVEKLEAESACQLLIEVDENNTIRIGAIPPMYYVETTVMPVFHNIRLTIIKQ